MATLDTLFSFATNNGGSDLITDAQGNLYGTTARGGTNDTGTVFELAKGANGYTQQILFSFAANNGGNATGANPQAGLIADGQGNLYGTAYRGGTNNTGTVFELAKDANGYTQQTLSSFAAYNGTGTGSNATGTYPLASLIADGQGNLYGTTPYGGTNDTGTVFELAKGANGYTQQTLFSFGYLNAFDSNAAATGWIPLAGLIADGQGNLYGTAYLGGTNNTGTVFELAK